MESTDLVGRLEQLESRVARLEDEVALRKLLSAYGPAVDSVSAEDAAMIWVEDGVYDVGPGYPVMSGRPEIRSMVNGEPHGSLVDQGCAHVMSAPLLGISGDRAIALGYHRLYLADGDGGNRLWRLSASRWDCVRTDLGWKVERRTHRLLDGEEDGPELLRQALIDIGQY